MANKVKICGVDTSTLPKLKNADLVALMEKVKQGDALARDQFVVANMRLVLSVVQRFGGKKDKSDDMFQVGCVGLIKAIDNFDTSLNVRFSTYAVPMIIGEIRRYLRDNNAVRVSRSMRDIAYKALQIKEREVKNNLEEPSIEFIAEELNLPPKSVMIALDAISDAVSLSDPVFSDGSETVHVSDQIADTKMDADDMLEKFALSSAIVRLNPREKEILLMRYYDGKTQIEVSEEVGISQAQVSRLEKNALSSLKKNIE